MRKWQLFIMVFIFSSCAVFNSKSPIGKKDDLNNTYDFLVKISIVFDENGDQIIVHPSKKIIEEINSSNGCKLDLNNNNFLQQVPKSKTVYAYRVMCELIKNLKKEGLLGLSLISENESFNQLQNLTLKIKIENSLSINKKIWLGANILTLGIVPYWNVWNYIFEAKAYVPQDKRTIDYSFERNLVDARQLLLLPAMPFLENLFSATKQIHKNLAIDIANEIKNDF